jgi:F-type H+-transporting ATPase subunit delta
MIDDKAGRIAAEAVSAAALSPAQVAELTRRLEKLSGKKVQIAKREDPALLGGVVAKVGDIVYDGSVRTQLRQLRDQLNK